MALRSHVIERFGGLNLVQDEQELPETASTWAYNVQFDRLGRIRTRPGLSVFGGGVSSTGYDGLWPSNKNAGELLANRRVGSSIYLDKISADGLVTNIGNWSASSLARVSSAVNFGAPGAVARVYLASGDDTTSYTLQKYDGTTITTSAGKPRYLTISPRNNRLVQAHYLTATDSPTGANGGSSAVFFSNPGDPDTYSANDFVVLRQGDGEAIVGMVTFRDKIIVFKQTRMYVFYGENTDDEGDTEFVYREVDLGARLTRSAKYPPYVVVGDDAVYFSATDGIYRTTGETPELISAPISPLYDEYDPVPSADFAVGVSPNNPPHLYWARGELFAVYVVDNRAPKSQSSLAKVLVWSPRVQEWAIWHFDSGVIPNASLVGYFVDWPVLHDATPSSVQRPKAFLIIVSNDAANDIYALDEGVGLDDELPILWQYQSGYYSLGSSGEKRVRFVDVYGAGPELGSVGVQLLTRGARSSAVADSHTTVALPTMPTVGRARRRASARGRLFSHSLAGVGQARIHRLELYFAPSERVT